MGCLPQVGGLEEKGVCEKPPVSGPVTLSAHALVMLSPGHHGSGDAKICSIVVICNKLCVALDRELDPCSGGANIKGNQKGGREGRDVGH